MTIHPVMGPAFPMLLLMLVFMGMIASVFLRDKTGALDVPPGTL